MHLCRRGLKRGSLRFFNDSSKNHTRVADRSTPQLRLRPKSERRRAQISLRRSPFFGARAEPRIPPRLGCGPLTKTALRSARLRSSPSKIIAAHLAGPADAILSRRLPPWTTHPVPRAIAESLARSFDSSPHRDRLLHAAFAAMRQHISSEIRCRRRCSFELRRQSRRTSFEIRRAVAKPLSRARLRTSFEVRTARSQPSCEACFPPASAILSVKIASAHRSVRALFQSSPPPITVSDPSPLWKKESAAASRSVRSSFEDRRRSFGSATAAITLR